MQGFTKKVSAALVDALRGTDVSMAQIELKQIMKVDCGDAVYRLNITVFTTESYNKVDILVDEYWKEQFIKLTHDYENITLK
jgi:hypothetical protein